jgi:hypothetical protein
MLLWVSLYFGCFCVCFVWVSVFKIIKRSKSNLSLFSAPAFLYLSTGPSLPLFLFLPASWVPPVSLVFHPERTGLESVHRHRPSSACTPGLCLVIARSRASCFAPELHTLVHRHACRPLDPRVCVFVATYLAPQAWLDSAHPCTAPALIHA